MSARGETLGILMEKVDTMMADAKISRDEAYRILAWLVVNQCDADDTLVEVSLLRIATLAYEQLTWMKQNPDTPNPGRRH